MMRKRDLFYYMYDNNIKDYIEISNMIVELMRNNKMTDEQEIFLNDFYARILFRIAVLEKNDFSDKEIIGYFDEFITLSKLKELKERYSLVINFIKNKLDKIEIG